MGRIGASRRTFSSWTTASSRRPRRHAAPPSPSHGARARVLPRRLPSKAGRTIPRDDLSERAPSLLLLFAARDDAVAATLLGGRFEPDLDGVHSAAHLLPLRAPPLHRTPSRLKAPQPGPRCAGALWAGALTARQAAARGVLLAAVRAAHCDHRKRRHARRPGHLPLHRHRSSLSRVGSCGHSRPLHGMLRVRGGHVGAVRGPRHRRAALRQTQLPFPPVLVACAPRRRHCAPDRRDCPHRLCRSRVRFRRPLALALAAGTSPPRRAL